MGVVDTATELEIRDTEGIPPQGLDTVKDIPVKATTRATMDGMPAARIASFNS